MAALETPWLDQMSSTTSSSRNEEGGQQVFDPNPPTIAAFSPGNLSHGAATNKQRSTILVHQKSPLLLATPPQITRALAYSHPFLLPLNKLAGWLTWTSEDPWESFLLVAGFWATVLYGDIILRWSGPVVVVLGLILGMYSRRYSPLSSTGWTGEKQKKGHKREESEATSLKHQKTLDEIVETLKVLTSRCTIMLDPLLQLTDFLSTQRTATSATTRPALTTLLIRILLVTPLWIILTLHPIHIITSKRIVLVTGTLILTWHSKPTRVSREILWRSALVRQVCAVLTGLTFATSTPPATMEDGQKRPQLPPRRSGIQQEASQAASAASNMRPDEAGVRFTFILYENQRRWMGLGWTQSLFSYERAAWTDEHLNAVPAKDEFELPDVEGGLASWRWVPGSQWLVEGAEVNDEGSSTAKSDSVDGGKGWIYYDNKWQGGRRGVDGWGKYTRRRKWYRDAELVETTPSTEATPLSSPTKTTFVGGKERSRANTASSDAPPMYSEAVGDDSSSTKSSGLRRGGLKRTNTGGVRALEEAEDTGLPGHRPHRARDGDWGIGDDARMGLE